MTTTGAIVDHISPRQFLETIIQPALAAINKDGVAAQQLMLGTAIQESRLKYVKQLGGGPALGYFQMEPKTHDDIWENFLAYRQHLANQVLVTAGIPQTDLPDSIILATNHIYAAMMARIHYARAPEPLPTAGDIKAMARYWKHHYNTSGGKGTTDEFVTNWQTVGAGDAFESV